MVLGITKGSIYRMGIGNRIYSRDNFRSASLTMSSHPFPSETAMSQVFDPIPSDSNEALLCCYVNATSHMQIARITNIANWYFERVVFPGQRLVFEAIPDAMLEIHSGMMASAILSDTIACRSLQIQEEGVLRLGDQTAQVLEERNDGILREELECTDAIAVSAV
jgi:Domain of unknown function (DUF1830)